MIHHFQRALIEAKKIFFWKVKVNFKYKIFRSHYVIIILVLRGAYLAITNLPSPLGYG